MNKPKYIARSGKPWTQKEVSELKKMGGKVPTRVIGLKLQRPVKGVQAKAKEINKDFEPGKYVANKEKTEAFASVSPTLLRE